METWGDALSDETLVIPDDELLVDPLFVEQWREVLWVNDDGIHYDDLPYELSTEETETIADPSNDQSIINEEHLEDTITTYSANT